MTNKTLRDYINLVENAQRESVAEGYTPSAGELARDHIKLADADFNKKYGMSKQQAKQHYSSNKLKEQGVAEGVNDTVYPNAQVIKSKNGKPIGEIYQDSDGTWGAFHYRADRGADGMDSREDAIEELRFIHSETGRSGPDYTLKGVAEDQLEETSPDAIEKIEQLVRK